MFCNELKPGMVVGDPKSDAAYVICAAVTPGTFHNGEYLDNRWSTLYWAEPVTGGSPLLLCFDREFDPAKYRLTPPAEVATI